MGHVLNLILPSVLALSVTCGRLWLTDDVYALTLHVPDVSCNCDQTPSRGVTINAYEPDVSTRRYRLKRPTVYGLCDILTFFTCLLHEPLDPFNFLSGHSTSCRPVSRLQTFCHPLLSRLLSRLSQVCLRFALWGSRTKNTIVREVWLKSSCPWLVLHLLH